MIHHAAGCADHDMHAAAQTLQLRRVALAAIDRQYVKARHVRGVTLERFGHLDREFAGRHQYQRLRLARSDIDLRQQRQRERRGLAGAGLRLSHHVGAIQQCAGWSPPESVRAARSPRR